MEKTEKKALKQFALVDKTSCITYLQRIIATSELCLDAMKRFNKQTADILTEANEKMNTKIPYDIYSDIMHKTSNSMCYLLNVLGDAQTSSISYFKYRKQAEKLVKNKIEGIAYEPFTAELEEICSNFNKLRNWQNHIPESLLTSEIELIKQGKYQSHSINPIEIIKHNYVEVDYMLDLYKSNCSFVVAARKLVQACKRDYSLLIGEHVKISRVYSEKPVSIAKSDASKLSAEIQGLPVET